MKKLYVYADFDWLKEVELIGELGYESLRGAKLLFVNAGEASYPFGNAEPFVEFRFNDGIDLATPAGLLNGEFAAFSAMCLIFFPFCPVFSQH